MLGNKTKKKKNKTWNSPYMWIGNINEKLAFEFFFSFSITYVPNTKTLLKRPFMEKQNNVKKNKYVGLVTYTDAKMAVWSLYEETKEH